jgi:heat shock protein HtpX
LLLLGANGVGVLRDHGSAAFPVGRPLIHLSTVAVARHVALPYVSALSPSAIEIHVSSGLPGTALCCRIQGSSRDLQQMQRQLNHVLNDQRSGQVIAGMVLLLALCGWIIGGEEGALSAVISAAPQTDDGASVSPDSIRRHFGARLLRATEVPVLFDMLNEICRRARLPRAPELYYLPSPGSMNAYAIGRSERSAIILADGLLRGMTVNEIAGILAHEVAHIRNDDACAMTWAAAMYRGIAATSLVGLRGGRRHDARWIGGALGALLAGAPAIAQLLWLGLSRIRELDADAAALEWVDDPRALVAALDKLERHHTGAPPIPSPVPSDAVVRFLRSHPATSERVDMLLRLAA